MWSLEHALAFYYFVMLICIFKPKMGEEYEYMDLVGYQYHESVGFISVKASKI